MADGVAVPYIINSLYADDGVARSFLKVRLGIGGYETQELAMIDSGADVCVLPRQTGATLGQRWEDQTEVLGLSGLRESLESRYLRVRVTIGDLPSIVAPLAWAIDDSIPVILGQSGFFSHFDVCFFRSRGEVLLRRSA